MYLHFHVIKIHLFIYHNIVKKLFCSIKYYRENTFDEAMKLNTYKKKKKKMGVGIESTVKSRLTFK